MKPLAQHITEGLNKVDAPLLEEQQTLVEEEKVQQSVLDIANIAPEKEKED